MIELKHTCVGLRCPFCGRSVIEYVNRFQFSSGINLVCPHCNVPLLNIKNKLGSCVISLNCFACGENHMYTLPRNAFFSDKVFSFSCKENDIDVLFTGNYPDVDIALFQLSKELDLLTDKYYEGLENTYGSLAIAALRIVQEKLKEKRIICLCGSYEINIGLSDGGISLICPKCKGETFIPISSEKDLNSLMERRSILIK